MSSRDLVPYGSGRESTRRSERDSTRDSRSHRTTTRGYTSHRDNFPSPSTSGSDRSTSRTIVRRDSGSNMNYAATQGEYRPISRHHNSVDEMDESAFSDDEGVLLTSTYPYGCSKGRRIHVIAEYEVEELPGGGFRRIRELPISDYEIEEELPGGIRRIREIPIGGDRRITNGTGDDSDGISTSRGYTTNRTGSTRYPTTTGSSRHHTNTGGTGRGTLTSSRHTFHSTAGGYRSTHGESSRSTRR